MLHIWCCIGPVTCHLCAGVGTCHSSAAQQTHLQHVAAGRVVRVHLGALQLLQERHHVLRVGAEAVAADRHANEGDALKGLGAQQAVLLVVVLVLGGEGLYGWGLLAQAWVRGLLIGCEAAVVQRQVDGRQTDRRLSYNPPVCPAR